MDTLDHGIVGADEFFSRLVVNYVKEYRVMAAGDFFRESIYEFHNERGLHFCSEQVKLFSYIADDNESCITKYMDYSLNCLLPDKFESITYKDNPLLFILCVADTIEPSKRFTNHHNEDVLKLISIDYNKNTNLLYVEVDEELYNCDVGHKYVSDIEGLEEWCDIKTSVVSKKLREY